MICFILLYLFVPPKSYSASAPPIIHSASASCAHQRPEAESCLRPQRSAVRRRRIHPLHASNANVLNPITDLPEYDGIEIVHEGQLRKV
jgi:hypothetical protein